MEFLCGISTYTYVLPWFGSSPPLIFVPQYSSNDVDIFQCSIFIHLEKVPKTYSPSFTTSFTLPHHISILSLIRLFYIPAFHCFSVCSLFSGVLSWYFTCKFLYFNQSNTLYYSSLSLYLYPILFSTSQCILLYFFPTQMGYISILFTQYHFLRFTLP
jgi:hypothetical protein